ncbi:phosphotransferase, partial [Helicosporidium sp. ATCC 50920]
MHGCSLRLPYKIKAALLTYLRSHVSNFPVHVNRLHVYQFSHGQSNPTYCIKTGPATYVVRKKPPGAVLPSAHAVEREYRVLRALKDSPVPVAPALALCEDPAVLGTAFYVMAHVPGRVWVDPAMPGASAAERKAAYGALGETLAALHSVDVSAIGLASFGRPDAYNSRQVRRWSAQYAADLAGPGAALPEMEALRRWLQSRAPELDARSDGRPCLVHGDFRLDNLVLDPCDYARVRAVLDWELSTLGDPWSDVAYCCLAYHLPEQAALKVL